MKLPLKKNLKFVLLGWGQHLCYMVEKMLERGFLPPVIITHPRCNHQRDKIFLGKFDLYQDVFELAEAHSLKIIEEESINNQVVIGRLLKLGVNAAFSLSCRNIIKSEFINAFDRRIFNLHPTYLPDGRGEGFSWKIMNGINEVAATLHFLDEGIDSGDIIIQNKKPLSVKYPYPVDFMRQTQELYEKLIDQFLDMLEKNEEIRSFSQNNDESTHFSRLYTEINGAIDWSWSDEDIERFIRAFSYPYPGSFSFIDDQKIHILKAHLLPSDMSCHSYAVGKIKTVLDNGSIKVVLKKHTLVIEEVSVNGQILEAAKACKVRQRFFTPYEVLAKAKLHIPKVKDMNCVLRLSSKS